MEKSYYNFLVGQKLKELRNIKDLKQEDMAQILKISRPYYSQIENGKRNIDIGDVAVIAREFDIPLDWFIGRDIETEKKIKNT